MAASAPEKTVRRDPPRGDRPHVADPADVEDEVRALFAASLDESRGFV
jgi:hypothetical protein